MFKLADSVKRSIPYTRASLQEVGYLSFHPITVIMECDRYNRAFTNQMDDGYQIQQVIPLLADFRDIPHYRGRIGKKGAGFDNQ